MGIRTIVKKIIPATVFKSIEPYGHLAEAVLANIKYGFPGRRLKVIGVTGTNGKTTTAFFIQKMLHEAGIKAALTSTVGYGVGDNIVMQKEHMTTSQSGVLQKRLKDFADQGVEWVVVETSSFALAQHRVWGVPYEIAVMTNITHDHLEYHGTFERYVEAKRQLFVLANKHGMRFGVVNSEDPSAAVFSRSIQNSVSYGIGAGDLAAEDIQLTTNGSSYSVKTDTDTYTISIQIPGAFNISNSLAALAVGRKIGLSANQIETGLHSLKSVEGRMNRIDEGQPFQVLIDFASTPDGFEKFFSSVRPLVKGKLVAVFGSAGRRDESKRQLQGGIAARYADEIVLTEEDDRDEDGTHIVDQIVEGVKAEAFQGVLHRIPDRQAAIKIAVSLVQSADDCVVFLGKGHEQTIEGKDGEKPWNEAVVVRQALKNYRKKSI